MPETVPPLDARRLGELQDLFEEETSGLFQDWFVALPDKLDELHTAIHDRDEDQVESMAHSLCGSSGSLGAVFVERISRQLIIRAKQQELDGAGLTLLELQVEVARLRAYLNAEGLLAGDSRDAA